VPEVTCVGILVADVIVRPVDEWPEPGRLRFVEAVEVHSGGLAHTTGVTLAKLGIPTAVVGRVGMDAFGAYLIQVLRDHGVEEHVRRDEGAGTSATVVAVSTAGERSFLHLVGANRHLVPEDVPDALLAQSRMLHLGGYFLLPAMDGEPAAGLLRRARAAGCRTSLDMAWDPDERWMRTLAPCLPHLDVIFGNRDELAHVTGLDDPPGIAVRLRDEGVGVVAVKLGEEGCYVHAETWREYAPAFAVHPVDTTGAGDAFCGGFLAGYLAGWSMERAAMLANAVGAMCVTAVGGTTGIRGMDETLRFLESAPIRRRGP
jgi:sugar/nucleoside kinase (ribokinase family)